MDDEDGSETQYWRAHNAQHHSFAFFFNSSLFSSFYSFLSIVDFYSLHFTFVLGATWIILSQNLSLCINSWHFVSVANRKSMFNATSDKQFNVFFPSLLCSLFDQNTKRLQLNPRPYESHFRFIAFDFMYLFSFRLSVQADVVFDVKDNAVYSNWECHVFR